MALNTIDDLSVTPASNSDFLGQSTSGTQSVSTLDNMHRNFAAIMARFYSDLGGVMTVGGSANAITVTSNSTYQTLGTGLIIAFKAVSANTGATTLNLDSLGAKAVRRQGDSALSANDIIANGVYLVRYDANYNSSAGAWVLLNPANTAVWQKGTDVASAATVSLGDGGFFHITGTTTITDIDFATPTDGRIAYVVFDAALTLTHNATTLILPGGANITTAAGDRAIFVQDSGDNVICISYTKADGTAVVAPAAGGITLLGTLTTTSGTTQSLTGIAPGYKQLYLEIEGVSFTGGAALQLALSSTNGSAYGTAQSVTPSSGAAANSLWGASYVANISSTVAATKSAIGFASNAVGAGTTVSAVLSTDTAAVVNAIQVSGSGGATFDAGVIRVYGVR